MSTIIELEHEGGGQNEKNWPGVRQGKGNLSEKDEAASESVTGTVE